MLRPTGCAAFCAGRCNARLAIYDARPGLGDLAVLRRLCARHADCADDGSAQDKWYTSLERAEAFHCQEAKAKPSGSDCVFEEF